MAVDVTKAAQRNPQQAAQMFGQMTRQNFQMLPAIAAAESSTVSFNIPKVRLTSRIRVMVEATLTVTHASATTYTPAAFAPFSLLRNVSLDMNNGFKPFSVSGLQLYMYSLMTIDADVMTAQTSGRGKVVQGLTASSGGTANKVRFLIDLPLTLNDRDPVGLVLTQNQETTVTVTLDFNAASSLLASTSGYTLALSNFILTPMVESFTIPAVPDAFPDLSILKLVQSSKQVISGAGTQTFKFPVGTTFRKFAFYVEDSSGGVADTSITSDIQILFNQADNPYKINPRVLAMYNHEQFRKPLPQGMYAFDFSYQGIANYGGTRDYIETEKLTEYWLQFDVAAAGNITVVYETLSRLRTGQ
jgi:hypothetical protein